MAIEATAIAARTQVKMSKSYIYLARSYLSVLVDSDSCLLFGSNPTLDYHTVNGRQTTLRCGSNSSFGLLTGDIGYTKTGCGDVHRIVERLTSYERGRCLSDSHIVSVPFGVYEKLHLILKSGKKGLDILSIEEVLRHDDRKLVGGVIGSDDKTGIQKGLDTRIDDEFGLYGLGKAGNLKVYGWP